VSQTSPPREAGTSQPARRSIKRRLSGTHLLIGIVAALAVALNFLALQNRSATVLVAVADRPLSLGSTFDSNQTRLVEVSADFEALESLVDGKELATYEGWILAHGIAEGALVDRSDLMEPGATRGLRSMALPIEVEHAAGGTIGQGDTVDVISVVDGTATYVGTGIEVLSVADGDDGTFGAVGQYHLVLGVDADMALALAEAIDSGSIEVLRSTGAAELDRGVAVDGP
jgi:Flp pilus assembly protein CpaB